MSIVPDLSRECLSPSFNRLLIFLSDRPQYFAASLTFSHPRNSISNPFVSRGKKIATTDRHRPCCVNWTWRLSARKISFAWCPVNSWPLAGRPILLFKEKDWSLTHEVKTANIIHYFSKKFNTRCFANACKQLHISCRYEQNSCNFFIVASNDFSYLQNCYQIQYMSIMPLTYW